MHTGIQIIPSKLIDTQKWDATVRANPHGLIYARSVYLQTLCNNWDGLIVGDYQAIMPLPWKKKYLIKYCYQPAFLQQTGIIGEVKDEMIPEILQKIQKFTNLSDIHFNYANNAVSSFIPVAEKTNFIIPLDTGYYQISSRYTKDLQDNIRKASTHQLIYQNGTIKESVHQYRKNYAVRMPHIVEKDYRNFFQLCKILERTGECFCRKATDSNGKLLATALFLKDEKRIYNLMNTTLPEGRDLEANHFLIDKVIKEFSGQNLLFDMEGSEIPGVKSFYASFGAENQPYFYYHHNALPWPLQLIKH